MRQPLLALLAKEPAHGYELKLALEQTFGQAYPSPNIGQIYVTLKRLEQGQQGLPHDPVTSMGPWPALWVYRCGLQVGNSAPNETPQVAAVLDSCGGSAGASRNMSDSLSKAC